MPPQEQGISWHVETHEHKDHSTDWYWALGLLALAGAALSIFFGNILLAVILLVGGGSIGLLVARGPREHIVHLTQKGLSLDGTLYSYKNIENFWVEEGENPRLLLTTAGMLHPQLVVPLLSSVRAASVRAYLRRFVEEEEQHPHLGERLAELFGL